MTSRRALVVHTRMPAFDRDSGSQDIDNAIRFLLDDGWQVTFLCQEDEGVAEARHARRLRQMGVATYAGFGWAERLLRSNDFDLALIAFWELAATITPLVREHSPRARVVINSIDVHFLRHARRAFGLDGELEAGFGEETARELTTYHRADAVITVSDKERALLGDFIGDDRVFALPLAEEIARSPITLAQRRGAYFVGNFRHLPNREAVEYLCAEILPLVDPELLERHPLTVIGNWLAEARIDIPAAIPGVRLVGWVPSVRPYVERARAAVVPLLHGAGVKRKVIQSMMAYTPVVTTPVGAEGLDLRQGDHALIGNDAADLAAGLTRVLTDDDLWAHLATHGADHVDARHGIELVRRRFLDIVDQVVGNGAAGPPSGGTALAPADAVRHRLQLLADPGAVAVVASGGDDALVELGSQPCWHFPLGRDGGWAGYDPVDGPAAVNHLVALRAQGARYFVLPKGAFAWRYRYPELHRFLECGARRVHQDEHLAVYDLAGDGGDDRARSIGPPPAARVHVVGRYDPHRTGPPPALLAAATESTTLVVSQSWTPDGSSDGPATTARTDDELAAVDYVVHLRDDAIVPQHFLDDLIAHQASLGVDRLQPTHVNGPAGGPPVTERHRGILARRVDAVTPIPVLSVRAGAAPDGPTVLSDVVTIGLREPLPTGGSGAPADVRAVWVTGADETAEAVERPEPDRTPEISVLVATYERPDLLRACLASFAAQTLARESFEVVVVDDGSTTADLDEILREFSDRLAVSGVRIAHAGRSAAKNLAVLWARAPLVLFFDDDDRAEPDYLERHLAAHRTHPDDAVAILGHTDWAPELEVTPLMHYVTDVDRLMFAYERLEDGQELDWRGFWEGRISCKRALLTRHGLHDQRIEYSIDVEMAWRLRSHGLRVVYDTSARSLMARPLDLDAFCARTRAKGRAHAVIAALHPGSDVARRLGIADAVETWEQHRFAEDPLRRQARSLEDRAASDATVLPELHATYRELFRILAAKGVAEATRGVHVMVEPPTTVQPFPGTDPALVHDGTPDGAPRDPQLSISLPVWSRTPELAEMARRTIERVWEVARVPTEVIVVDNGSPHEIPLPAKVYRYPENKGVATGWNTGIRLSSAAVVAVLNSDCRVEPGWDEALYEAALAGRRVAFPYTDHCDGLGFVQPDQGGTAGWCFMMRRELYDEIGVFDEWFNPAFCEDTDYWHRAWQLGVELSPVPAARVVHARRTTANTHPHVDWLLTGHRYKYGWKHGVEPLKAPPYYDREIVEYHGSASRPR